jgi:hypothetical protein
MSFLDVFKSERKQREVYGIYGDVGYKVLILSYLLLRATDIGIRHKLLALYSEYNRGSRIVFATGVSPTNPSGISGTYLTETYSRVIPINAADLSGVGTFEEQIVEFINNSNLTKAGEDAEVWVEVT